MGATRIFKKFNELLDVKTTRPAPVYLRVNANGSVSEIPLDTLKGDILAAPGPIGATTPGTGAFTYLSVTGGMQMSAISTPGLPGADAAKIYPKLVTGVAKWFAMDEAGNELPWFDHVNPPAVGAGTPSTGRFSQVELDNGQLTSRSGAGLRLINTGSDAMRFETNGAERARFSGTGLFGLGTTNPLNSLQITRAANHGITIERTGTGPGSIQLNVNTGGDAVLLADQNIKLSPLNTTNAFVLLNTTGYMGLGIAVPTTQLHVYGATSGLPAAIFDANNGGSVDAVLIRGRTAGSYASIGFRDVDNTSRGGFGYGNASVGGNLATRIYFYSASGNDMLFSTNGGAAANLFIQKANANIGIGNILPLEKLDVTGNLKTSGFTEFGAVATPSAPRADCGLLYYKLIGGLAEPHMMGEDGVEKRLFGMSSSGVMEIIAPANVAEIKLTSTTNYNYFRMSRSSASAGPGDAGLFLRNDGSSGFQIHSGETTVSSVSSPNTMKFVTGALSGGTERMTILGTGNVGIGVINPLTKLDVLGTIRSGTSTTNYADYSNSGIATNHPSGSNYTISGNGLSLNWAVNGFSGATYTTLTLNGGSIRIPMIASNRELAISTNGSSTPRMWIDTAGAVGIGNILPLEKLDVTGSIKGSGLIELAAITTPAAPRANCGHTYFKIDGGIAKPYFMHESGSEYRTAGVNVATGLANLNWNTGEATMASAATVDLSTTQARVINLTGTVGITSFGTSPAGDQRDIVAVSSGLVITGSASILMPTAVSSYTTVAGDRLSLVSSGAGIWRLMPTVLRSGNARVIGNGNTVAGNFTVTGIGYIQGGLLTDAAGSVSWINATTMSGSVNGNLLLRNNAGTDFTRIQLGGVGPLFPSLGRNLTALEAKLADGSDFCPIKGKLTTHTAASVGTITPTHTITLYDADGVAWKVPALAA